MDGNVPALTPNCPACGAAPTIALGGQSFCGDDDCIVICWDPAQDGNEQLTNAVDVFAVGKYVGVDGRTWTNDGSGWRLADE
jgi:hypothetical protein